MKDKSKLVSSVIVSLLAGFIYYQFGAIEVQVQKAIKQVFSQSVDEQMPMGPFFSLAPTNKDSFKKKQCKFLIRNKKRNTFEYVSNNVKVSSDELLPELVSSIQAKHQSASPDLSRNNSSDIVKAFSDIISKKEFKIITKPGSSENSDFEIASIAETKPTMTIDKSMDKSFTYVFRPEFKVLKKECEEVNSDEEKDYECSKNFSSSNECQTYSYECKSSNKKVKRVHIEIPQVKIQINKNCITSPKIKIDIDKEDIDVDVPSEDIYSGDESEE